MQKLKNCLASVDPSHLRPYLYVLLAIAALILVITLPGLAARQAPSEPLTAGDLLSYYGALLGAGISIATLMMTIAFTRRQILSEQFNQKETDHWRSIDEQFTAAIASAHPLLLDSKLTEVLFSADNTESLAMLRVMVNDAKIRRDTFRNGLDATEELRLSDPLGLLDKLITDLDKNKLHRCDKLVKQWRVLNGQNGSEYTKMKTRDEIQALRQELLAMSEQEYQQLLEAKNICFNGDMGIYAAIDARTRGILDGKSLHS